MKDSTRPPDGPPQPPVGMLETGRGLSVFDPDANVPRINRIMVHLTYGICRSLNSRRLEAAAAPVSALAIRRSPRRALYLDSKTDCCHRS